jgi:hypothetical protein
MAVKIPIPKRGINKGMPISEMPQEYSSNMNNVRVRDVLEGRVRVGQRPAIVKWSTDLVGGSTLPVCAMCSVTTVE